MTNNYYQKHKERLGNKARKNIKIFLKKKKSKGKKRSEKDIKILLKNKSRKYLSIDRFQKSLNQLGLSRKVSNTITVGWKPTKCGSVQQK